MNALTLWQPWASLMALDGPAIGYICTKCGWAGEQPDLSGPGFIGMCPRCPYAVLPVTSKVKHLETRSWPAPQSAIGQRFVIHAAKRPPTLGDIGPHQCAVKREHWWLICPDGWVHPLPLGAIVASGVLAGCVPIVYEYDLAAVAPYVRLITPANLLLRRVDAVDGGDPVDVTGQLPYGDFRPGRWAWIFTDLAATTERCPACWGERSVEAGHSSRSGLTVATDWCRCPVCNGAGRCDPIPAKGRQGVWRWNP